MPAPSVATVAPNTSNRRGFTALFTNIASGSVDADEAMHLTYA